MFLKCVASYLVIYLFVIENVVESRKIQLLENQIHGPNCNGTTGRIMIYNEQEQKYVSSSECCEGFEKKDNQCKPECSKCDNGNCIGPEKCDCCSGYTNSDEEISVPECNPSCVNAECIAPNKCQCNDSFIFMNKTHCVESDFLLKQSECVRICDNGICELQCICNTGYVQHNGSCMKTCDEDCFNGKCIGNVVCECNQGYKEFSPSRCVPECSKCYNGECIGPEKCDCYSGYTKSDEGICVPECNPPCVNAECIAPNKCQCNDSFILMNQTHCVDLDFLLKRDKIML